MTLLHKSLLLATLGLAVSGCSTIKGWFSSTPTIEPAALIEFKASASLTKQWEANVGAGTPFAFSPATDGDAVYAAGRDGKLAKLDIASGRAIWQIDLGRKLSAGVGLGDGLVLVGTPKGELLAFKDSDGSPAWQAKLSGEILVPPVAGGGVAAARSNDGRIAVFDSKDGKQRWIDSRPLPALTLREQGYLALAGGALHAGQAGGKLSVLSLANGGPLWESNVSLPRGATELERISDVVGPLAIDSQLACAAAYQGRIACFNRSNGNPVWSRDFSSLRGVDMGERHVYADDEHDAVYAFERTRGSNTWKQDKLRDRRLSSPVVVAGRYVAVGDYQGQIHLLDGETGAFAARAASDGSAILGSMIPLKSGLIVQTGNGAVMAYRIQ